METLLEVLTQYVEENLVLRYLGKYTPQIGAARARAEMAAKTLRAMSPDAPDCVETLEIELGQANSFREQAFLLAGVSIGLELGRL